MKQDPNLIKNPHFTGAEVKKFATELYGLAVSSIREMDSYTDQNFYLKDEANREFVFKISNAIEDKDVLDMQHKAMEFLSERIQNARFPGVCETLSGKQISTIKGTDGAEHFVRMLTFLPGKFLVEARPYTPELLHDVGYFMGTMNRALASFSHRAANIHSKWDLKNLREIIPHLKYIENHKQRTIIEHFLLQFDTFVVPALPDLRMSISHNDGNEYNIMVVLHDASLTRKRVKLNKSFDQTFSSPRRGQPIRGFRATGKRIAHEKFWESRTLFQKGFGRRRQSNFMVEKNKSITKVSGIIDFGDMLYTYTVCEPAIAAAYAILGQEDVIETAAHVIGGYFKAFPLTDRELEILLYLISARLCISVTMGAFRLQTLEPDNEYLKASSVPAREALEKLMYADPVQVLKTFRSACGLSPLPGLAETKHKKKSSRESGSPALQEQTLPEGRSADKILELRRRFLNPSLSISYKKPLKIVRGLGQYLYDETGRAYLDCVNNVCHVGHCHPRVVRAASRQLAVLNTNTRYLHDNIVEYAQRLCSTLPEPLRVCYFVNSGSEANDLALRLARTYTKRKDIIVVDHAYHGNLTTLIEISAYKFDGPGGSGALPFIHKVNMPDVFRGPYKASDREAGEKYAREVGKTIEKMTKDGRQPAAFICESLPGVGGQIVLPENYLKDAFHFVREAGGLCIADEVQVGFGRVGSHFWGFETQAVVPDIVTFGKPIGNGFPLGAVVTTEKIAATFNTGMEYFNTFGGNPVSCAVGLAVLDVIRDEKLQKNARTVGNRLLAGLKELQQKYALIGDVRGMGLFIGIELVMDRENLSPAAEQASHIIEKMKNEGILLSVDGPLHNVIKIKPPIVFDEQNADRLVDTLDKVMKELDYK